MMRQAVRLNSLSELAITKLDILDALDTVKVCVAYDIAGERVEHLPYHQSDFHAAKPIYEELPGWSEDISGARGFDDLPAKARDYVLRLEELAGAQISCIGVGPGREQTIVVRDVVRDRA